MKRTIKLPDSYIPREYQFDAKEAAKELVTISPELWHMFSSPTGTGKSVIEIMLLQEIENSILVTPRIEIIAGILDKAGFYVDDLSRQQLVDKASEYGLFTPIRLRNMLSKGTLPFNPSMIIVDECHHDLADSYQDIQMYLNGIPKVGFTATPYRGTPRATAEFHAQWNNTINTVLTLKDAVQQGYCSFPHATTWPLVDDDVIEVTNGEISSKSADAVISDRIEAIVTRSQIFYDKKHRYWDRPTMFAVPTTNLVNQLTNLLNKHGLPAVSVTQETSRVDRIKAFEDTINCTKALVQIDVVSEGVDLPIRRLIDVKPTMSPVRWVQLIGRIMRPVQKYVKKGNPEYCEDDLVEYEYPPEYICCCRNIERHGYLMEGLFPNAVIKDAQDVFMKPSKRSGMRAVGLEGLGRFTNTPVKLLNGVTVFCYSLVSMDQFKRTEYFVMVHPNQSEPIYGVKESPRDGESIKWGKWKLIQSIPDVKGFQSAKPYPLTDPQRTKWNELAEMKGLDPHQEVTNRNIQSLFFLLNTGLKLK